MKQYRISDLSDTRQGHFLGGIASGQHICRGGMGYKKPGERTHDHDGADGSDDHTHEDCETFVILQGKGQMEIDGTLYPVTTGDIVVVEPGENHHLIADEHDPCINLWLHTGSERHSDQQRTSDR